MIGYPNAKKTPVKDGTTSTANRGMTLERDLNDTNEFYLATDRAVIHKKPTPIQVVHVDYPDRTAAKITEAYYRTPSTTDYNGVYKGRAIDFEAKEIKSKTSFPFQCIHEHQIEHLKRVIRHGAIAFVIVRFTSRNETYLVPADRLISAYDKRERASVSYTWFTENGKRIPEGYSPRLDYLRCVDELLKEETK